MSHIKQAIRGNRALPGVVAERSVILLHSKLPYLEQTFLATAETRPIKVSRSNGFDK